MSDDGGKVRAIKSPPTAQERIVAAQKKRAALREAFDAAVVEQKAIDDEAIGELEAEHGYGRVRKISIENCWKEGTGAPVFVGVLVPTGASKLAQRFIDQINRSKEHSRERITAQDALATECWVYPPKGSDAHKAALELAPLILGNAAVQIVKAVQGQAEEEGKE